MEDKKKNDFEDTTFEDVEITLDMSELDEETLKILLEDRIATGG